MAMGCGRMVACMQERRPLKRAVCIPLECIVVIIVIFSPEFSENILKTSNVSVMITPSRMCSGI